MYTRMKWNLQLTPAILLGRTGIWEESSSGILYGMQEINQTCLLRHQLWRLELRLSQSTRSIAMHYQWHQASNGTTSYETFHKNVWLLITTQRNSLGTWDSVFNNNYGEWKRVHLLYYEQLDGQMWQEVRMNVSLVIPSISLNDWIFQIVPIMTPKESWIWCFDSMLHWFPEYSAQNIPCIHQTASRMPLFHASSRDINVCDM